MSSLETNIATLSPTTRIAFIGAGNMASSIAGGLIQTGLAASQITFCEPSDDTRARAGALLPGVHLTSDNHLAAQSDVIILSVKPQVMETVCTQLLLERANGSTDTPMIISVAAGITIQQIAEWLNKGAANIAPLAIVRCMPNTPALVNEGATGYYANEHVSTEQKAFAHAIASAVGLAIELSDESKIDAVTALSGSGPAYFFFLMEAMIEAGQLLGLDQKTAEQLTLKTALGAAKLASDKASPSPDVLRERVTSPKGTTEAAIHHMEQSGMKTTVIEAMKRAFDRAEALSK